MSPCSWVVGYVITPKPASRVAGLVFDVFISVFVCRDCESVSDKPFSNVFVVARYAAQHTTIFVVSLDFDSYMFTAEGFDQFTLNVLSVTEPVAALVSRRLIPLRCVETGKADVISGYPDSVGIGHVCLAGDRAFPEQKSEEKEKYRNEK